MKRIFLSLGLSFAFAMTISAQVDSRASGEAASQTSAAMSQAGKSIQLDSGTQLSGQLQSTIDVRKAKVGDQVLLKTTQAIKSGGRTVVAKGSRLVGHITEVAQRTKNTGESRIGILFDRLESGSLEMPIAATITSITNAGAGARGAGGGAPRQPAFHPAASANSFLIISSGSCGYQRWYPIRPRIKPGVGLK